MDDENSNKKNKSVAQKAPNAPAEINRGEIW